MKVFKVVYKDPITNRLLSTNSAWINDNESTVEYKLGHQSLPPEGLGPLLAFKSFEAARDFIDGYYIFEILLCEATPSACKRILISSNLFGIDIKNFWLNGIGKNSHSLAEGSIWCDSITPIYLINKYTEAGSKMDLIFLPPQE